MEESKGFFRNSCNYFNLKNT